MSGLKTLVVTPSMHFWSGGLAMPNHVICSGTFEGNNSGLTMTCDDGTSILKFLVKETLNFLIGAETLEV